MFKQLVLVGCGKPAPAGPAEVEPQLGAALHHHLLQPVLLRVGAHVPDAETCEFRVTVKSWVNVLAWLLIGCSLLCSQ